MVVDGRNQLLEEERQEDTTDSSKAKVVAHEKTIQLERWSISHNLSASQNYNVIYSNHYRALFQSRHWRNAWLEIKVLGVISHQGREGLVEDGP